MHSTVMSFLRLAISADEISGKTVLELGSYSVNGSPRSVLEPHKPKLYIGVDQCAGPCVDVVLDAGAILTRFGARSFDVVVSTEMLEHAADWKTPVDAMKEVLRPGGLLILTTRGPGMVYHGFPDDHWRFTIDDIKHIFADMDIQVLWPDPELPGILLKAKKPISFSKVNLSSISVGRAPK